MLVMRNQGFTLVELLIGMVIAAILMLFALPTYQEFMGNTRIRNTADSLAHGVRLAQVEAIKRNENVTFEVNPAAGWTIRDLAANPVHREPFSDTSGMILVDPRPAGALKLTYNALGQFVTPTNPDDGTPVMTSIRVTHTTMATPNHLRVTTDPAWGSTRVCEPRFTFPADPAGCPVGLP